MTDDDRESTRSMLERMRRPGGTRGGAREFLLGVLLIAIGGYLFLDNVVVTSGWGELRFGRFTTSFGVVLIPLLIGIGLLFFDGKSKPGWLLTVASGGAIVVGIISKLEATWRPTSLLVSLLILGSIAAGIGLVARGLKEH
jgi:uncharacterized protein